MQKQPKYLHSVSSFAVFIHSVSGEAFFLSIRRSKLRPLKVQCKHMSSFANKSSGFVHEIAMEYK